MQKMSVNTLTYTQKHIERLVTEQNTGCIEICYQRTCEICCDIEYVE